MSRYPTLSLASLALSLVMAQPALAADRDFFYVGAALGSVMSDYGSSRCTSDVATAFSGNVDCKTKAEVGGRKLVGGFRLTPNLAVEAAWADLGEIKATLSATGAQGTFSQKTNAKSVTAVASLDLDGLILSTKGGLYSASQTASDDLGDSSSSTTTQGLNIGLRADFAFGKHIGGRIELESYKDVGSNKVSENFLNFKAPTIKSDLDMFSVGLVYSF